MDGARVPPHITPGVVVALAWIVLRVALVLAIVAARGVTQRIREGPAIRLGDGQSNGMN